MAISRFSASFKGITAKVKETMRRNLIDTAVKEARLHAENELLMLSDKKDEIVKALATGDAGAIKTNLKALNNLISQEDELRAEVEMTHKVLAVLDENVEVEE